MWRILANFQNRKIPEHDHTKPVMQLQPDRSTLAPFWVTRMFGHNTAIQSQGFFPPTSITSDTDVSLAEVRPVFEEKARAKGIDPSVFAASFDDRIGRYERRWDDEMEQHLADPPHFDEVVRALRRHLRSAGLTAA